MRQYELLGNTLELSESLPLDESWKLFLSDRKELETNPVRVLDLPFAPAIHQAWHYRTAFPGNQIIRIGECIVLADENWRQCQVIQIGHHRHLQEALLHILYSHVVKDRFVQVHSSLVEFWGHGLMFLGPSGIGKTTQAELWNKYMGAQIINGDLVFVQQTNQSFLGWGSPWHGSSPYCENTSVPLRAMVVLKQSKENALRRITGFEMVSEVAKSIFYPMWLENGTELCLETLNALLGQIPVYELSCRPDEDSVRLLYNELVKSKLL